MDEAAIRKRLVDLNNILRVSPVFKSDMAAGPQGVYRSSKGQSTEITVDEWLDHLCLQVKYLLFDLEATRRENRYLRQMLERHPHGEGRADGDDGPGLP